VRINGPDGILIITIEDPERIGSGRVELAVDGRPIDGDCIAIPTDGMERRVTACLRPSLTNLGSI
jgi:cyclic beta-1,2-glucan synthetase